MTNLLVSYASSLGMVLFMTMSDPDGEAFGLCSLGLAGSLQPYEHLCPYADIIIGSYAPHRMCASG